MTELFESTARCLRETRPEEKCDCTLQLFGQWRAGEVGFEPERAAISIDEPGRPERPELVHPGRSRAGDALLPRRRVP